MKTISTLSAVILAAALLVPSAARAQSAFSDLGAASGLDVAPLRVQVAALQKDMQQRQREQRLRIPRQRRDVFEACSVIDAKAFRAYTLDEAAAAVQGCLDQTYGGRRYTVSARSGRFSMRACPQAAGQLSCQAIVEVQGLIIKVDGTILTGDSVLADLDYSLSKRGGKLLGFRAAVDDEAVLAK